VKKWADMHSTKYVGAHNKSLASTNFETWCCVVHILEHTQNVDLWCMRNLKTLDSDNINDMLDDTIYRDNFKDEN